MSEPGRAHAPADAEEGDPTNPESKTIIRSLSEDAALEVDALAAMISPPLKDARKAKPRGTDPASPSIE